MSSSIKTFTFVFCNYWSLIAWCYNTRWIPNTGWCALYHAWLILKRRVSAFSCGQPRFSSFAQWNALQPVWVKLFPSVCFLDHGGDSQGIGFGCLIILSGFQWMKNVSCGDLHLRTQHVCISSDCLNEVKFDFTEFKLDFSAGIHVSAVISREGCGNCFETREVNSPLTRTWNEESFKMLLLYGRFSKLEIKWIFLLVFNPELNEHLLL